MRILSVFRLVAFHFVALFVCSAQRDPVTARKLLDGAVEMSAAVHPETGVAAVLRAGIAYGSIDKAAGLALLRRAFSASATLDKEELREEYASAIVRAAAELDVQSGAELLRQLPKPASAATAVVRQLIASSHFDQAMELLALVPDQVEYPYEAASYLLASLPEEDSRRAITFGRATAAFARVPAGPFPLLVERFGKQMPAELRGRAVSLMLGRIAAWKDSSESFSGVANDDDPDIEIHSPQQTELRELVSVARLFDPAAVERIVATRQDVNAALGGFRRPRKPAEPIAAEPGKKDDGDDEPFSPPFGIGMGDNFDAFRRSLDEYGKAMKQAEKITELTKKDPGEAVRVARTLPEMIRAEALAVIASAVVTKDAALATSIVDSCVGEIERIENPASRIPALVKLGGIYTKLKDPPRAYTAYERALADAVPLWSRDTRSDRPNVASRDTWPSTQAVRMTAYEAALNLGAGAQELLSGITVADLAVLARIQMARALLALPPDIHNINVRWVDKDPR
jgi:hypothetical protein